MSDYPTLTVCPVCNSQLVATRLACTACETAIEGRFALGPFAGLSREQLAFAETFIRCEGKLKAMEGELGISYPTVRSRLHELIRALGYEPGATGGPPVSALSADERRQILEDLEAGVIDLSEAMRALRQQE